MNDHTEPLVTLALGDPAIVPPTFADVIDTIIAIDPGLSLDGHTTTIDRIVDELNDTQMDVVKTIAALITLRQAATSHQTFTEWLATTPARRISHSHVIAQIMDENEDWPRDARSYGEYRDYIAENHPGASHVLDHAWDHYRAMALAPYGDAETVRTETQYAARISWDTGYDEIHPKTADGTRRNSTPSATTRTSRCRHVADARNLGSPRPRRWSGAPWSTGRGTRSDRSDQRQRPGLPPAVWCVGGTAG